MVQCEICQNRNLNTAICLLKCLTFSNVCFIYNVSQTSTYCQAKRLFTLLDFFLEKSSNGIILKLENSNYSNKKLIFQPFLNKCAVTKAAEKPDKRLEWFELIISTGIIHTQQKYYYLPSTAGKTLTPRYLTLNYWPPSSFNPAFYKVLVLHIGSVFIIMCNTSAS